MKKDNQSSPGMQSKMSQVTEMKHIELESGQLPKRYIEVKQTIVFENVCLELASNKKGELFWLEYKIGSGQSLASEEQTGHALERGFDIIDIVTGTIKMPTNRGSQQSEGELIERIKRQLKRVARFPCNEDLNVASLATFATYTFDLKPNISYLGFTGFSGNGKTAVSDACLALSYCAVKINGGDTEAAIFRYFDKYRGTTLIDECQDQLANPSSRHHKILTVGSRYDGSIAHTQEARKNGQDRSVKRFSVYGPKIFSGLSIPGHDAILNRTFEIKMPSIPYSMQPEETIDSEKWQQDSISLRNDLVLYRQRRMVGEIAAPCADVRPYIQQLKLSGRERDCFKWLFEECPSETHSNELCAAILKRRQNLSAEKVMQLESQILLTTYELGRVNAKVPIAKIAQNVDGYEGRLNSKIIMKTLRIHGLETHRAGIGEVLTSSSTAVLRVLERLGLDSFAHQDVSTNGIGS